MSFFDELHPALLQATITLGLACLCALLYRRYRKPYFGWWAIAWALYLLRLVAILTYLPTRQPFWLFAHQVATGWTALALLWGALVLLGIRRALFPAMVSPAGALPAHLVGLRDLPFPGAGPVSLRRTPRRRLPERCDPVDRGHLPSASAGSTGSFAAGLLGGAFFLWGLHHLDYPVLRAQGAWNPWGYYLDIIFLLLGRRRHPGTGTGRCGARPQHPRDHLRRVAAR